MDEESQKLALLKQVPMRISGSWVEKTVTTDPPRYVPHTEYAFSFQIACDEEILLAFMLVYSGNGRFGKKWRSAAASEWKPQLSFFPMNWRDSEVVHVNFEGLANNVEHPELKHDPRPFVSTRLLDGEQIITSGSLLTLASVNAVRRIECRAFAVAKTDTVAKRGRWSLKSSIAAEIPDEVRFLLSGATSGTF